MKRALMLMPLFALSFISLLIAAGCGQDSSLPTTTSTTTTTGAPTTSTTAASTTSTTAAGSTTSTTAGSTTSTVSTTTSSTTTTLPEFHWTKDKSNTPASSYRGRYDHTSVVFNDKVWVIAGMTGSGMTNDVWSSDDNGETWDIATPEAAFPPLRGHSSVVFDNKIWVIGGTTASGQTNEVWISADGVNWTQIATGSAFSACSYHASVVFDSKVWVIAGYNPNVYPHPALGYIWSSPDGVDWTQEESAPEFGTRIEHSCLTFNGSIWLTGGRDQDLMIHDSAWSSSNGRDWASTGKVSAMGAGVTSSSEASRMDHASVVYEVGSEPMMFVMGGKNTWPTPDVYVYYNNVWCSSNGAEWQDVLFSATTSYPASREGHSLVVRGQRMIMTGGYDGSTFYNDVWHLTDQEES